MKRGTNLVGKRFHKLLVVENMGHDKHSHRLWKCLCDCGNYTVVTTSNLNGTTHSCGCIQTVQFITHGMTDTRIYQIWSDMKTRCDNPDNNFYNDYGGRGISYDLKWKTFEGFLEDMQEGYSDDLTLDRVDVNGGYTKQNCRWATKSVQSHNRRKRSQTLFNYIGLVRSETKGRWVARIRIDSKARHLGSFKTELAAATAYDDASEDHYGDRPNGTKREE